MELKNTINGTICIIIAVCLVCGMLVPIMDGMTGGEPTVNPDAGWIRMNYDTSASTYAITIAPTGDGVSVTNGTDTQTGSDETILYADSNVAVWIQDSAVNVLGQNTDGTHFLQPEDTVTVTRTTEGVTVTSGEDSFSFATPDWAYVPWSTGNYGFFNEGDSAPQGAGHVAAVGGGFAGVYAYNDITRYSGLGLQLQTVMENGDITEAYWDKAGDTDSLSTIASFDHSSVTIQPLDPSIISLNPGSSASLMAVPTPTYTDGDWGYDTYDVSGTTYAKIVSYSGAGGDIVVPATVGGYTVRALGSGNSNANIISTSTNVGHLTISNGPIYINEYAFAGCTMTGLTIPSSVTQILSNAFRGCTHLIGDIIFPTGLTSIGADSFRGCSNIDGNIVIPDTVTSIRARAFDGCSKISGIVVTSNATPDSTSFQNTSSTLELLNLSDTTYAPGSYGLSSSITVSDNIGNSVGYMGTAMVPGPSGLPSSITGLMFAIPVVILASLLGMIAVAVFKRDY